MASNQFKIVIVGNGCVGKSTYVNRLITSSFREKYVPKLGVEVDSIHLNSNYGKIVFNVWDVAGIDKYGGLKEGYYVLANGVLVMYDITESDGDALQHVRKWVNSVSSFLNNQVSDYNQQYLNGLTPVVICGTKCDISSNEVPEGVIKISSKTCENLYEPLLTLARVLMNKHDLVFSD